MMVLESSHKTRSLPRQHDLFEDSLRAAWISGVEVRTKLYVSNLDHGVTNEDKAPYAFFVSSAWWHGVYKGNRRLTFSS
ncbi:hypothetical protein REPUB_Repub14bG0006500 [Reevesia pubescens]